MLQFAEILFRWSQFLLHQLSLLAVLATLAIANLSMLPATTPRIFNVHAWILQLDLEFKLHWAPTSVDARFAFQTHHLGPKTAGVVLQMKSCALSWFPLSLAKPIIKSKIASASTPHQDLLHLKICVTAPILNLKLLLTTLIPQYVIAIISHLEQRPANAVLVNKLSASNSSPNVPQSMEFQLLKAASAPPLVKMAPKFALAFLEESTTSFSHPCLSMPRLAIVPLLSMELSKELVTAASLMLSTCKQDNYAKRIVMHQAACADLSMALMLLVTATTASSSTQLPQIFQLTPKIALVSSNLSQLTQPLHHWTELTQPMLLLWDLSPEVNAHAAQERLILSDLLTSAKIDPHNWLSATNASISPMEWEDPISATVSAPTSWTSGAPHRS